MSEFDCGTDEHFLFGTLIVRVVRKGDRTPIQGLRARIGLSVQDACGSG